MAVDSRTLGLLFVTDADFRSWGTGVAAGIAATGVTKVTQTGEINWTTVTMPAGVDLVAGFEVYRLTGHDGLPDIFIKIEYGTNGQSTGGRGPSLWVTVGYGANGSGTITGNSSGQAQIKDAGGSAYNATAGQTAAHYSSGNGVDRLTHVQQYTTGTDSTRCAMFHIERMRDANGLSGDGVYFYLYGGGGNTGGRAQIVPPSGTVPTPQITNGQHAVAAPDLTGGGARQRGVNIAVCAHTPILGRQYATSLLVYWGPDITGFPVDVAIDHFGAGLLYRALGAAGPQGGAVGPNTSSSYQLLVPYY